MTDGMWRASMQRRDFLRASAGAVLGASGLLVAACGPSGSSGAPTPSPQGVQAKIDGDLYFFNWSQYLSPDVIKGFEKHYGVKVHQTYFDNMQSMMAKLTAGIPYDITFPVMDYTRKLRQAGYLMPIDHSQLSNWHRVPAYFDNPWYDPGARYSVPYAIWTTGICWHNDVMSGFTGSWNDFWTVVPKYPGKVYLLDDYQEVLGMSLLRLGFDINSGDAGQVSQAADEVLKIKHDLRGFSTDDITNLNNGNALAHHAWSGDVWQVIQAAKNPQTISYETCKEGVPTGNDTMVIPKNAKHPGTALLFIDWMLMPENATTNVNYFGYPQVTTEGLDAFNKLAAQYPSLNITLDTAIHGLRELAPDGAKLQMWDQAWAKVKAG
jgi:spermidine/putrescine transport system substrate-binding protein